MTMLTRFGVRLPTALPPGRHGDLLDHLAELSRAAESSGFDSLWVADGPSDGPVDGPGPGAGAPSLEAYTLLGALAVRTTRARLGALVTPVGWRPPAIVAKQVTTLDRLSGGRAVLGLGAGTAGAGAISPTGTGDALRPGEPEAIEEIEELEDALRICRAMFDEEAPTVAGHHRHVASAANRPRPLQPAGPPIVVGSTDGDRIFSLAVSLADGCNVTGPTEVLRRVPDKVRRLCDEHHRDRRTFSVTAVVHAVIDQPATTVAQIEPLFESGMDGVVLDLPDVRSEALRVLGPALLEAFGPDPRPSPPGRTSNPGEAR